MGTERKHTECYDCWLNIKANRNLFSKSVVMFIDECRTILVGQRGWNIYSLVVSWKNKITKTGIVFVIFWDVILILNLMMRSKM